MEKIRMEESGLFWITLYKEETERCSFDFEKASDSHYVLDRKQAARLAVCLGGKGGMREIAPLLQERMEREQIAADKAEEYILSLLRRLGIQYKEFHFE